MNMWQDHGTKIMGYVVGILGAVTAFQADITTLWFDDRGDQIVSLVIKFANYLLIGAGAVIVRRGYTNSRRDGETPFRPGEET